MRYLCLIVLFLANQVQADQSIWWPIGDRTNLKTITILISCQDERETQFTKPRYRLKRVYWNFAYPGAKATLEQTDRDGVVKISFEPMSIEAQSKIELHIEVNKFDIDVDNPPKEIFVSAHHCE
jgi:hypothetical protein